MRREELDPFVVKVEEASDRLAEMEIQQPQLQARHLLHHNIYESIKSELPLPTSSSMKSDKGQSSLLGPCNDTDMLFGVNSFGLQASFCQPATNNNHETVNHNHSKNASVNVLGRTLTADRKRPYPCNLCPSRFGSKMELEEHQNSHTGMKPFECDVCKARFNRRSTLWNHKRIHSDAKPFVCTVCQMTFKWKNSLKCHKEMHLRKNESSTVLDNDLRQLTYATAAKKRLLQMMEEGQQDGTGAATSASSAIHSQPLITTSSPKKKGTKNNQQHALQNSTANGVHNEQQSTQSFQEANKSWLQAGLLPPSDHPLDLDTSSLDTLVQQSNQNLLVHLCSTEMDPRHASSLLGGVDDPNAMLTNHIFSDMKPDVNLLHSHDLQFNYSNNLLQSQMGGGSAHLNVPIPIVSNLVSIPRINGVNNTQQLPSVHHLTSTSMPAVSVNMDYSLAQDGIQSNVAHPQYIVTTQPDMMLSQSAVNYQQPFQMDHCVVITPGQAPQDYLPNYDFNSMGLPYQLGEPEQQMVTGQQQQGEALCEEGKVLPFDQW